jgi:hypothetical protein
MVFVTHTGTNSLVIPGRAGAQDYECSTGKATPIPRVVWSRFRGHSTITYLRAAGLLEVTGDPDLDPEQLEQPDLDHEQLDLDPEQSDPEQLDPDPELQLEWRRTHWRRCAVTIAASSDLERLVRLQAVETRPGVLAMLTARVIELEAMQ